MSKKFLAPAILGTAVALSGCGERNQTVQSCSYDQNLVSADLNHANKVRFHVQGLVYPIIVACSEEVRGEKKVTGSISYGRSVSMANPSTGNVHQTSVPDAQAVQNFVSELNLAPDIDDRVRTYYSAGQQATINVLPGSSIQATASPDGQMSGGDISLIQETSQNQGNARIAKMRAESIAQYIKKALEKSGAKVEGLGNIEYSSSQTYLKKEELGELYQAALAIYGNGPNRVMQLIADYNTGKIPKGVDKSALQSIIDAKRKGDIVLVVNAKGTKQTVDISYWSYVYLLILLGGAGYVSVQKIKEMHDNSKETSVKQ